MQLTPLKQLMQHSRSTSLTVFAHPDNDRRTKRYFVWINNDLYRFDQFWKAGSLKQEWRSIDRVGFVGSADQIALSSCAEIEDNGVLPVVLMQNILRAL